MATAGKPWWNTRYDVTGSDFHYLPPCYSLAVPHLKVPSISDRTLVDLYFFNIECGVTQSNPLSPYLFVYI